MGPVSSDDEKLDERAKRRLRRRLKANGIHKPDVCTAKKSRVCNAQVESLMLDDDYDEYFNKIHKYGWDWIEHSSGHDVNGDCEKEGNDTRVVEDSIDRNEHCGADDGDGGNSRLGDDDDMDPQYKLFWDNLRENGNSYVLQIVQEDGRVKEIRYHQDKGAPDEVDLDNMHSLGKEKTPQFKNREIVENVEKAPEKRSSVKKRNVKFEAPEPVSDGIHVRSSKRHCLEVPNTPDIFGSSQLKEKTGTRKNSRMVIKQRNLDDCPQKKNGLEKKSSMLRKNVKETDTDNLSDENYHEFLSCSKNDGKGLVFTSRICGPLRYDEESLSDSDEESSSDSDVIVLDRDPHEGYHTQIMMDVDSRRSTESHSQFRQGIMQDLIRPYHLEEYLSLLEDWSRQRPPTGHDKNLRNGKVKSYALEGEFGRSYQEMYKDLARKMDAVTGDDRPRKLNLLRGFFYWLKNIAQHGSFKPWNDKACLKVLPQKH
ncbi:hypothetical protein ACLB2K_010274 [Fragaria x ananassa]